MTHEDKKAHPEFGNTGGFLKKHGYKDAWAIAWGKATEEQKKWFFDLPNFNPEIFLEVTGIDVRKQEPSLSGKRISVEIDGKKYSATVD